MTFHLGKRRRATRSRGLRIHQPVGAAPPGETFYLLQENGDRLLQENGDGILLESAP